MLTVALVELGPDHGQVHGPLDDLVVMTSLHEKHHYTWLDLIRAVTCDGFILQHLGELTKL